MAIIHVTLATRSVERSLSFFETVFGWRRIERPGNIGMPAAWLAVAPGQEIHLLELDDFAPSTFEREFGRHIAVSFPHGQFPELKRRLVEHGVEIIAAARPTPFERFFFRDPNGYIFEVVDEDRKPEA